MTCFAVPCKVVAALASITVETRAKHKCRFSWKDHKATTGLEYSVFALPHLTRNALQSGEGSSAQLVWYVQQHNVM